MIGNVKSKLRALCCQRQAVLPQHQVNPIEAKGDSSATSDYGEDEVERKEREEKKVIGNTAALQEGIDLIGIDPPLIFLLLFSNNNSQHIYNIYIYF